MGVKRNDPFVAMLTPVSYPALTYWYLRCYRISRATDRDGKLTKKKWKAVRYETSGRGFKKIYFSRLEQAARWVVLDA